MPAIHVNFLHFTDILSPFAVEVWEFLKFTFGEIYLRTQSYHQDQLSSAK